MNKMEAMQPPEDLSRMIKDSIAQALREEKIPKSLLLIKTIGMATVISLILMIPLFLMFRESLRFYWLISCFLWWGFMIVGFSLYYQPQPRLEVPGYFSPLIFSKILISMTTLSIVQILICPDLAFLSSPIWWSPFRPLTNWFMAWGGMTMCMFSCGFIFSSTGAIICFSVVRKTIRRGHYTDFLKLSALAFATQLPLFLNQLFEPGLQPFAMFWLVGCLVGVCIMVVGVRALNSIRIGK